MLLLGFLAADDEAILNTHAVCLLCDLRVDTATGSRLTVRFHCASPLAVIIARSHYTCLAHMVYIIHRSVVARAAASRNIDFLRRITTTVK